jgi:hypothetical protein
MTSKHSPREIVSREFLNNEQMFLNIESQRKVSPGDIIIWEGRHAQFEVVSRLSTLGLKAEMQTSSVKSTHLYNSASGVTLRFEAKGTAGLPTMHFKYSGSGRYSIQAYDSTLESLDEVALAAEITRQLAKSWDKEWIVITSVWRAAACTHLISGDHGASAGICAGIEGLAAPFNIADIDLKVALGYGEGMHSQEIASEGACPFFVGMKYHVREHHQPHMVRYGG